MNVFDQLYEGHPPWDIGRPQRAIRALSDAGLIIGDVLDAGCGTAEHAILLSRAGHNVVAIDSSAKAIETAGQKARYQKAPMTLICGDVLQMAWLGRQFDTVIDSGLFHNFSDDERQLYTANLESVVRPGGRLHLLCFSNEVRSTGGPRPISLEEIHASFHPFWTVEAVRRARFETMLHDTGAKAWLATLRFNGHVWPPIAQAA